MDKLQSFPFEIGQEAESKSHVGGYRGAWFRCKIKDINLRKSEFWCALEYFDFPDEKISWTKVYQKDPTDKSLQQQKKKMQLMMRPRFPRFYRESDEQDPQIISGMVAIINDEWEVGNMVDLWSDGCFWSGKIVAILDNGKVQVELPKPPIGEGGSYCANSKDLRPTLFWSIEDGWTVPLFEIQGNFRACVRLSSPLKTELMPNVHTDVQALYRNSFWRSLVLQYSNSNAEILSDWKLKHQEEPKHLSSSPDSQDELMDITRRKHITCGMDHLPSYHSNLSELVQVLSETDGGKQLVHELGVNLKVGSAECLSTGTINSEALETSNLCHNYQAVMLPMDESNVAPSSSQCHDLGVSHQDWCMVRSDTKTAITAQHPLPNGVESSVAGINIARNDSHQSLINDAPSVIRRNALAVSRHKKDLVRTIVERAKSIYHGRGRLKRKSPPTDHIFSFSVDGQINIPSNKHGKSCIGTNSNIDDTTFTALTNSFLQVHGDVCSVDFLGKSKQEETSMGESYLAGCRSHSTGQRPSRLKNISSTDDSAKFGVSQTGCLQDSLMEVAIPKQIVDSKGVEGKTYLQWTDGGFNKEDIQTETSVCKNEYSDAHIKSNNQVKHMQESSCKKDATAQRVISTRMGRNEHGSKGPCMDVDTIESSVMALEELVNKVRWLRGVMQFGFKQWSAMTQTTWQFVENPNSCKEAGAI